MRDEPPIRRHASRVVYENRWMTVREDDVVRADGSTGIFGVVEKPDFALVIPFDGVGFYTVEQYRYPVGGRFVEFPQGSYEESPGIDPVELARGELAEETGLRAGSVEYLGHLFEAYGYSTQGFHVFLATELEHGEQGPFDRRGVSTCLVSADGGVPRGGARWAHQGRADDRGLCVAATAAQRLTKNGRLQAAVPVGRTGYYANRAEEGNEAVVEALALAI